MKNIQHIWPCFIPIMQVFSERMTPQRAKFAAGPLQPPCLPSTWAPGGLLAHVKVLLLPFFSRSHSLLLSQAGSLRNQVTGRLPPFQPLTASSCQVRAKECLIMADAPNSLKASSERPTYHKILTGTSLSVYVIINTMMVCVPLYGKFARFSFVMR